MDAKLCHCGEPVEEYCDVCEKWHCYACMYDHRWSRWSRNEVDNDIN